MSDFFDNAFDGGKWPEGFWDADSYQIAHAKFCRVIGDFGADVRRPDENKFAFLKWLAAHGKLRDND